MTRPGGNPVVPMTQRRSVLVFMGTRPEAIKLAPVVAALRRTAELGCTVVATGQHREMFQQVADQFGFSVVAVPVIKRRNQTLTCLTARLIDGIDGCVAIAHPDGAR